jgi:tetratricopeptide (TPR) repeat protein
MSRSGASLRLRVIATATIACSFCSTAFEGQAGQQGSVIPDLPISELRRQIKVEEAAHAGPRQLATLWIALADSYLAVVDNQSAEDAFAHAIRLSRGARTEDLYANALDGIATVYFATGRANTADRCLRQALDIEHAAADSTAETSMRRDLAVALIAERKYAEAEKQASEALDLLEAQADPSVGDEIVLYLTRSRAICGMRRCKEALEDVDRAEAVAVSKIGTEPSDIIAIAAVRGMEQFHSGALEQGERTVQQALRLIDSPNIPSPAQIHFRVLLLEEYSQLLEFAHKKRERKYVEEELTRAKAQQLGCDGCTVSAASLGLFP